MFATTLTTDRLVLRPFQLSDAEAIFDRYASDPEVTRFLSWPPHLSMEETRGFLGSPPMPTKSFTELRWAICLDNDPLPWGMMTAWIRGSQVELGYCLARSKWGQGIMSEATKGVMKEAWRQENVWRVWASCHPENKGSARVMEKCGMNFEGKMRRRLLTPAQGKRQADQRKAGFSQWIPNQGESAHTSIVLPQMGSEPQDSLLYAQVRDDL